MICTSPQIFSIEITKTNTERQKEYCELKKGGVKILQERMEKTKTVLQENQGTFQERIEETKRSSKNNSTKTLLIPRKNFRLDNVHLFSYSRVTHIITFDCFHVSKEKKQVPSNFFFSLLKTTILIHYVETQPNIS